MFESYTYESLLASVLDEAPDGIDTREGSIFYDAISACCIQMAKLYVALDQIFDYVFIDTTSGEYLDSKAAEYGLDRNAATTAQYYYSYTGTQPSQGQRFFHSDTGIYFYLSQNDDEELILIAETEGTAANDVQEGDLAVPVNTVSGLTTSTFGAVYQYGEDEEDDESFRTRLQEKIAGPAENGNKQHYKTWCESVDGVGLARIFPLWNGPNTVKAVLITPEGLPCAESTVETVQEYVDPATLGYTTTVDGIEYVVGDGLGEGAANLGAHFTATAALECTIDVELTVVLTSTYTEDSALEEITDLLEAYFAEMVLESDAADIVVRISAVGAIIIGASSITDYSDLTINGSTENIIPDEDYVPVLGEVTINVE